MKSFQNYQGLLIFQHWIGSGYWQIKLDEKISKLLTFNTPFGRYRYTSLPFGVVCANEILQKEIGKILEGLDGQAHYQDHIIV